MWEPTTGEFDRDRSPALTEEEKKIQMEMTKNAQKIFSSVKFTKPDLDEAAESSIIKEVEDKLSKDIFEHIRKARLEAERRMIEVNMIVIDSELAMTNKIYYLNSIIPPMIFGLEVKYQNNLTKDFGTNFIITNGPTRDSELELLRIENKELKEQIRKMKEVLGVC